MVSFAHLVTPSKEMKEEQNSFLLTAVINISPLHSAFLKFDGFQSWIFWSGLKCCAITSYFLLFLLLTLNPENTDELHITFSAYILLVWLRVAKAFLNVIFTLQYFLFSNALGEKNSGNI